MRQYFPALLLKSILVVIVCLSGDPLVAQFPGGGGGGGFRPSGGGGGYRPPSGGYRSPSTPRTPSYSSRNSNNYTPGRPSTGYQPNTGYRPNTGISAPGMPSSSRSNTSNSWGISSQRGGVVNPFASRSMNSMPVPGNTNAFGRSTFNSAHVRTVNIYTGSAVPSGMPKINGLGGAQARQKIDAFLGKQPSLNSLLNANTMAQQHGLGSSVVTGYRN